jgi:polyhydroxybutyrate depolymerase
LITVLLLSVASLGSARARPLEEGRNAFEFEGQRRAFHLHLPPGYDGETPLPLVVVLHGGGGSGKQIAERTGFAAKADAENFVAVFPNGQAVEGGGHYWKTEGGVADDPVKAALIGDDVAFLSALIAHLKNEIAIESRRVYVTGFSNGAAMTLTLACRLSDQIAAVAAVSSGLSAACDPASPLSVLQMLGSEDPLLQSTEVVEIDGEPIDHWYAIDVWSAFNECPAEPAVVVDGRVTTETHGPCAAATEVVKITLEGVGHHWPGSEKGENDPVAATDVVWDFLSRHEKAEA